MITAKYTVNTDTVAVLVKGRERQFVAEFIQDLAEEIVNATPVKTGFLRASWAVSVEAPGEVVLQTAAKAAEGKIGDLALQAANAAVEALDAAGVMYVFNSAAYAMRVEFGFVGEDSLGRKYNQPPRAFVRGTLDRAASIAEAAARRVANGS